MRRRGLKPCNDCGILCSGFRCKVCFVKFKAENKTFDKTEWRRARLYGLAPGGFDLMWKSQRGLCKLCSKELQTPSLGRGQGLDVVAIDHCHATGKVRGLLCNACNKGIGLLNDDPKLLKLAIEYLENL